jgi:hypothetical protein
MSKVISFLQKGLLFQVEHQKKFALGGIGMGAALGFHETNQRNDFFYRLTPCEKRVKYFENMYFDGMIGGIIFGFPLPLVATGVAAAATFSLAMVAPMMIANKLCEKP